MAENEIPTANVDGKPAEDPRPRCIRLDCREPHSNLPSPYCDKHKARLDRGLNLDGTEVRDLALEAVARRLCEIDRFGQYSHTCCDEARLERERHIERNWGAWARPAKSVIDAYYAGRKAMLDAHELLKLGIAQ